MSTSESSSVQNSEHASSAGETVQMSPEQLKLELRTDKSDLTSKINLAIRSVRTDTTERALDDLANLGADYQYVCMMLCKVYLENDEKDWYDTTYSDLTSMEHKIGKFIGQNESRSLNANQSPQIQTTPLHTAEMSSKYLKRVELPQFSGTSSFQDWIEVFEEMVDKTKEPASLKMHRLKESLTGEAKNCIRGLGLSATEYEAALQILQERYGSEFREKQLYLQEIEKMDSVRYNDPKAFDRLYQLVRTTVAKLKAQDRYLIKQFNELVERRNQEKEENQDTIFTTIEEENESTEADKHLGLYEGDIRLTALQALIHRTGGDVTSVKDRENLQPTKADVRTFTRRFKRRMRGRSKRSTVSSPASSWPNGIIPYVIDDGYDDEENETIHLALEYITTNTCIKLVNWTDEKDYMNITNRAAWPGCWSWIGRNTGMQELSLDHKCTSDPGVIQHEFMHLLGFWHEHMRPDRDDWIKIDFDNIKPENHDQFEKQPNSRLHGFPYDTESLMHYSPTAFAIDRTVPTIRALHQASGRMGQRDQPTDWDLGEIRNMYNCEASTRTSEGTGGGAPCVFPFIYDGRARSECLLAGDSGMTWCGTTGNLDEDKGGIMLWGYCIQEKVLVRTEGGNGSPDAPCHFPFRYAGSLHYWCLTDPEPTGEVPWCATTPNFDVDKKWGRCLVPVDGGWGPWSDYTPCSKPCGGGTQTRERLCTNPRPRNGGRGCGDLGKQTEVCNEHECVPETGVVYTWEGCWWDYGFPELLRSLEGEQSVLDGKYWTRKHAIDKCAQAAQKEKAKIFALRNGGKCFVEDKVSRNPDYKSMGPASDCPSTKVGGVNSIDVFLISKDGVINGGWSVWSDWSPCTQTCGGGLRVRLRTCSNPQPSKKGRPCEGDDKEEEVCSQNHCPVDGGWGGWSDWSDCSMGVQSKLRLCDDPPPSHGGAACAGGAYFQLRFCDSPDTTTAWRKLLEVFG